MGVRFGGGHVPDILTLAQHGYAVGNRQHLVQLVRDDDDALAVGLHIAQHGEQLFRFLRRQHGGRLVKDQEVRAAEQYLHDLEGLLLRNGHVVDLLLGIDLEPVGVADLADLFRRGLEVEPALQAEHDVFCGGEHIYQLEVLMDHADAMLEGILRRADDDRFAIHQDLALVREINAGEHVHQGRLTAPVLAQEGQDLARVNGEVDPAVRHDFSGEYLGDIPHFNSGDLFFQ